MQADFSSWKNREPQSLTPAIKRYGTFTYNIMSRGNCHTQLQMEWEALCSHGPEKEETMGIQ